MSGSSDSKSPDWAIERARASLKLGMQAPEIEKRLIAHGLAAQGATAAVEKALEDQVRQQCISNKAIEQRILAHRILSGIVGCSFLGLGYWLGGGLNGFCFLWFVFGLVMPSAVTAARGLSLVPHRALWLAWADGLSSFSLVSIC